MAALFVEFVARYKPVVGATQTSDVMILCAGLGTRLRPLTERVPKPLLPIGDRPQLAHILEHLAARGVRRVVINTHHLADQFREVRCDGISVERLFEPELLGTAGGVANARARLSTPLVVWNGDILAWPELEPLRESVRVSGITLLASRLSSGVGTLGLARDGRVVRLRGERFGEETSQANYTGVLALGADALSRVPERGCLIGDLCLPWLRAGKAIGTLPYSGEWTDIGTLGELQRANLAWLRQRGHTAYAASDASIAPGVVLDQSLVHGGAVVSGTGALRRAVVLSGARAVAPLSDVVVLEDAVWGTSS